MCDRDYQRLGESPAETPNELAQLRAEIERLTKFRDAAISWYGELSRELGKRDTENQRLRDALRRIMDTWIYCPKHGHSMKPVVLGQDDHFACIHLGCGFELKAKECDR